MSPVSILPNNGSTYDDSRHRPSMISRSHEIARQSPGSGRRVRGARDPRVLARSDSYEQDGCYLLPPGTMPPASAHGGMAAFIQAGRFIQAWFSPTRGKPRSVGGRWVVKIVNQQGQSSGRGFATQICSPPLRKGPRSKSAAIVRDGCLVHRRELAQYWPTALPGRRCRGALLEEDPARSAAPHPSRRRACARPRQQPRPPAPR